MRFLILLICHSVVGIAHSHLSFAQYLYNEPTFTRLDGNNSYTDQLDCITQKQFQKQFLPIQEVETRVTKKKRDTSYQKDVLLIEDKKLLRVLSFGSFLRDNHYPYYDSFNYDANNRLIWVLTKEEYTDSPFYCYRDSSITFFTYDTLSNLLVSVESYDYRVAPLRNSVCCGEVYLLCKDKTTLTYDSLQRFVQEEFVMEGYSDIGNTKRTWKVLYQYHPDGVTLSVPRSCGVADCSFTIRAYYTPNTQQIHLRKDYNQAGKLEREMTYLYNETGHLRKAFYSKIRPKANKNEHLPKARSWYFTWDDKGRITSGIVKNRWGKCLKKTTYEYLD